MRFAVSFWTSDNWEKDIEALRVQGVTALETGDRLLTEGDEEIATAAGEAARRAGIEIFSCHGPLDEKNDLTVLDEALRKKTVETHIAAVRRTALAGAKCMVLHSGVALADRAEVPRRRDRLRASIESLLPAAERYGVTLALENMPPKWLCNSSDEILKVLKDFDSPALGACLDTGHAHLTEEGALSTLEALSDRIVHFHLHDNNGSWDQHLHPPYGTIDWEPIVQAIRRMNFDAPILIEAPPSRLVSFGTVLKDAQGLFEHGFLTVELDGRKFRVICPKCGRYAYGQRDRWFCACA